MINGLIQCSDKLVLMCPTLRPPADGNVLIDSRIVNGTAFYLCDNGFMINGPVLRQCLATGEWSGMETVCDRKSCDKYVVISSEYVRHTSPGMVSPLQLNLELCPADVWRTLHLEWSPSPPHCLVLW